MLGERDCDVPHPWRIVCTRSCSFCGVQAGATVPVRPEEAAEVPDAVSILNLKHAVITWVEAGPLVRSFYNADEQARRAVEAGQD
jgi:lipoate synthase